MFGLFGKWHDDNGDINFDALNINQKELICITTIKVNEELYKITRMGKTDKGKKNLSIHTFLHKLNKESGIYESEIGKSKDNTEKIINQLIGTVSDFLNTTVYLQKHNENNFFYLSPKKKLKILSRHCGVEIIDKFYLYANEHKTFLNKTIKDKKNGIETLKSELGFDKIKSDVKKNHQPILNKEVLNKKIMDMEYGISKIDMEKDNLHDQKKNVSQEELDDTIDEIKNKLKIKGDIPISKLLTLLVKKKAEYEEIVNNCKNKLEKIVNVDDLEKSIKEDEHKLLAIKKYLKDNEFTDDYQEKQLIKNVELQYIDEIISLLDGLIKNNCGKCQNILLNKINHYQKLKENKIKSMQHGISFKDIKTIQMNQEEISNRMMSNKNKLIKKREEINDLKREINNNCIYRDEMSNYHENLTNLVNYINDDQTIKQTIKELENKKDEFKEKLKIYNAEMFELNLKINLLENNNIDLIKKEEEVKILEDNLELYKSYCQIMSTDGLYAHILSPFVNLIEEKVNMILKSISNMKMEFYINKSKSKSKIKDFKQELLIRYLKNDGNLGPRSFCGAEVLFATLAFKLVLREVSKISTTNFFAIDEGLSAMDGKNRDDMLEPITLLMESKNKFVFVIDHNEIIKLIGQNEIIVEKDKYGFASVFSMNMNQKEMIKDAIDKELDDLMINTLVKIDTEYTMEENNIEDTLKNIMNGVDDEEVTVNKKKVGNKAKKVGIKIVT